MNGWNDWIDKLNWIKNHWYLVILGLIASGTAALYLVLGGSSKVFVVAGTSGGYGGIETKPAVAYNSETQEIFVSYLYNPIDTTLQSPLPEVRTRRFSKKGEVRGNEIHPFGQATYDVFGRPATAYGNKSNTVLVAVSEHVGPTAPHKKYTADYDRVLVRYLDATGSPVGNPYLLFEDEGSEHSGVHTSIVGVAYNSELDEFLVTVQRSISSKYGVWAQRMSGSGGPIGSPVALVEDMIGIISFHCVGFAPIANTNPPGGQYLFVSDAGQRLLDSQAEVIRTIPMRWGPPEGKTADYQVAFGTVEAQERFLVVYWDRDNCRPGLQNCSGSKQDQWTGVWGTYINPEVTDYNLPMNKNSPFPISSIHIHTAWDSHTPRVVYNGDDLSFYVVWREVPEQDPNNDESRSHIRANKVDYFVDDGIYAPLTNIPKPHKNTVVTKVSGDPCTQGQVCLSSEDPSFPDLAMLGGKSAVVVWEQNGSPHTQNDKNIMGIILDSI